MKSLSCLMKFLPTCLSLVGLLWFAVPTTGQDTKPATSNHHESGNELDTDPEQEQRFLNHIRQLTFEGRRAGEGYFGRSGNRLVFQSEREAGNPFFQIYLMDLETGDTQRVSPGHGKTTCAWIFPDGQRVLFASTHEDPAAREKQEQEIAERETGKKKRYSWDFDEHYDLFIYNQPTNHYQRLTTETGYDAEASCSPDGGQIVFASNRSAYEGNMTEHAKTLFEHDPASMMDIYIMHSDGTGVRRLTDVLGYDGGPFFSPNGKRICWRRFAENGAIAEVMTMHTDGSDPQQLTRLGAMSWAPFYHPSGEYLIFSTNLHGFANFELYLVDTAGKSQPVRVTWTDRFDGLPVFTPDGKQLAWTSSRTANTKAHLFIANWNHDAARQALGLSEIPETATTSSNTENAAHRAAHDSIQQSLPGFKSQDILRHVDYLCRPDLMGRLTGTLGEKMATAYVAAYWDQLGLIPGGDDGSWYQEFHFTSGVDLGPNNQLMVDENDCDINIDWRPVSFSQTGTFDNAEVVFAGYGIVAPANEEQEAYDSYVHLDVTDKWVMVLRYMPGAITAERRQQLARYSSLRYKTMVARDRSARGLIVVSGPQSEFKDKLVPLRFDGTLSGSSLPVISVSDQIANQLLANREPTLQQLQQKLDSGEPMMGLPLDHHVSTTIDIEQIRNSGRNVIGRLTTGDQPTDEVILVGAHIDHLGKGTSSSSLARDEESDQIHFGADDNASGVAVMLEIAEYLSNQKRQGKLPLTRDILFAGWSGEELGLLGSSHFVKSLYEQLSSGHVLPEEHPTHHVVSDSIYPAVAACINMDMVGRLDKNLVLHGVGSSSIWPAEIERRNAPVGLPIRPQNDSYIPTDASVFFMRGVPILSAFTGSHSDYHTPRDTPDKLNYDGAAQVARFMGLITRSLAIRETPPDYIPQERPEQGQRRANLRAFLGTIPDYAEEVKGVKLSGVSKNGPAAKAGMRGGDIIVKLAGKKIDNIYDYTFAIEALKIGQPVKLSVQRDDKQLELEIIPESRD